MKSLYNKKEKTIKHYLGNLRHICSQMNICFDLIKSSIINNGFNFRKIPWGNTYQALPDVIQLGFLNVIVMDLKYEKRHLSNKHILKYQDCY